MRASGGCSACCGAPKAAPLDSRRRLVVLSRAAPENGQDQADTSASDDDATRIAAIRRGPQEAAQSSNPIMGAIEEAQLITWPTPKKAVVDTALVLAIVVASGTLLFSFNVALSSFSELWYHR